MQSNELLLKYMLKKIYLTQNVMNNFLLKKQDVMSNFHQNNKPKKHK